MSSKVCHYRIVQFALVKNLVGKVCVFEWSSSNNIHENITAQNLLQIILSKREKIVLIKSISVLFGKARCEACWWNVNKSPHNWSASLAQQFDILDRERLGMCEYCCCRLSKSKSISAQTISLFNTKTPLKKNTKQKTLKHSVFVDVWCCWAICQKFKHRTQHTECFWVLLIHLR